MIRHLVPGLMGVMLMATPTFAQAPLGNPPTYTDRKLGLLPSGQVPNHAAILRKIWMPGLDDGFVPQGLSVVAGSVYVAAYKSPEGAGRGPCRLYRLDPTSGKVTGILDLPSKCGHAGGVAKGPPGHLWVADTRDIFEVRLDQPASAAIGKVRTPRVRPRPYGSAPMRPTARRASTNSHGRRSSRQSARRTLLHPS